MLAGGKRENTWIWLPGWIFIYASWQNKLAGAEIHAARLWLVIMLYNHFYYFSMNVSTFGVNFRSSESKPSLFLYLPLLLWEQQKTYSSGSKYSVGVCFEHHVLSELGSHLHPERVWSKEESPCATATGSDCFRHDISQALGDHFSLWKHIMQWGFVCTCIWIAYISLLVLNMFYLLLLTAICDYVMNVSLLFFFFLTAFFLMKRAT